MKKFAIVFAVLAVVGIIAGIGFAQSDYASRTGYSIAKAPQSTVANIHKRMGTLVAHYVFDIDGAPTEDLSFTIKEGIDAVRLPDNSIVSSNAMAYLDITTASDTSTTGTIAVSGITLYSGPLTNATTVPLQISGIQKVTTPADMTLTVSDNVPTSDLSFSIYLPYILGN